jgi:hypothetical protein
MQCKTSTCKVFIDGTRPICVSPIGVDAKDVYICCRDTSTMASPFRTLLNSDPFKLKYDKS